MAPPSDLPGDAEQEAALRQLFDEGARAWPGVALPAEVFVADVAELSRRNAARPFAPDRGPDLYLACACAHRVPGAIEAFDRAHLTGIGAYLTRLRPTPALVDEVRQEVRTKLHVGRDGTVPWIAEYDGRGALGSWVRVVSIRVAIDLRRQAGAASRADERALHAPAPNDPERDLQKMRYQRALTEAVRDAVSALDREQRRILRLHFADGATLDALAAELGVHRATVARRLAAARTALRRDARNRLRAALGCTDSEAERQAADVWSQLDLTLSALLRTA
jgi:RNA polymerase sigma-70 factor (ECF subfamily)